MTIVVNHNVELVIEHTNHVSMFSGIVCGALLNVPNTQPGTNPTNPQNTVGSQYSVRCNSGFTPELIFVFCQTNGQWEIRGTCTGQKTLYDFIYKLFY